MTKVKASKARKTGTSSVSGENQKALEGRKMITAERNGETRNFTTLAWGHLPPEKEGWKETSDKPAEIPTTTQKSTTKQTGDEVPLKKEEVNNTPVNMNMVDHVITQDDLDLDPELAKSGVKVGETIQIEKKEGGSE